jgi:hypothetical protein
MVTISDPYIANLDKAQEEIALRDGHQVRIVVRSHANRAQYSLLTAPSLPTEPWEPAIQKLLNLESRLDAALLGRYNALAAGSLAGLTEEERKRVTARPQLETSLVGLLKDKIAFLKNRIGL